MFLRCHCFKLVPTLSISTLKSDDFQKCKPHKLLRQDSALCRGQADARVLVDCWDTSRLGSVKIPFQLQWSMSFEGYVVVFWPLNAYKCHGCCKNLILLVLGAGFPCKREHTQRNCTLSTPRWESKLYLMTYRRLQVPQRLLWGFFICCRSACLCKQWYFRDP